MVPPNAGSRLRYDPASSTLYGAKRYMEYRTALVSLLLVDSLSLYSLQLPACRSMASVVVRIFPVISVHLQCVRPKGQFGVAWGDFDARSLPKLASRQPPIQYFADIVFLQIGAHVVYWKIMSSAGYYHFVSLQLVECVSAFKENCFLLHDTLMQPYSWLYCWLGKRKLTLPVWLFRSALSAALKHCFRRHGARTLDIYNGHEWFYRETGCHLYVLSFRHHHQKGTTLY